MPRPELPLGTWGRIRREQLAPRSFRARARFRDYDGVTRNVEACGPTGAAAERNLQTKLRDRTTPSHDDINGEMRIERLAELWLAEKRDEGVSPQTLDRYKTSLRTTIAPALGRLRVREAAVVSRVDRFFKTIATEHPAAARGAKTVLGQMLDMAIRHDALATNPVRNVARQRGRRRKVKALNSADLARVRAAVAQWNVAQANKPGPRHTGDLADIIDLLLATGERIGEILALRWADLNLAAASATLTVSGTIVYVKGRGYYRQDWTKSDAGYRTLTLPRFAVAVLLRRHTTATPNPNDAVFASRRGTWLSPHNVRRQWRQARTDTGLEWVTPHTFRKTVATLIDRQTDTKTASAQLGHANEQVTTTHYIEKANIAPDVSHLLQQLGVDTKSAGLAS
jgi:integrase